VSPKAVYELGYLVGASVRGLGKLIHSHPWRVGGDTGISRVQMLMKVLDAEADNGDVHTLHSFGAQRARHGSRGASHRLRLSICQIGEVIDMPPCDDQAVTDVRKRIGFRRRQVKGDDLDVFPQEPSGELDLARDLPTH
jgi:hypothetical protein